MKFKQTIQNSYKIITNVNIKKRGAPYLIYSVIKCLFSVLTHIPFLKGPPLGRLPPNV